MDSSIELPSPAPMSKIHFTTPEANVINIIDNRLYSEAGINYEIHETRPKTNDHQHVVSFENGHAHQLWQYVQYEEREGLARPKKKGVSMTWKELWVTVEGTRRGERRAILEGVTGYVEPGEVLAIMGPSGSGKSTLLDALAGRLASNTRQSGKILINGRKRRLAFGTSAYVTQDDTLMTTLTVKEAVYYSAQLQLPDSMSPSEKKERAESTIREMGLEDAMNTRIGGWGSKGLSGGEKRRVSICIEILTRPKLLFLDEPTSGLDSAASFHVMSRIIDIARRDRRTVVTSIHQPSEEVFELFHNLCLLSSGKTVYFGSTSRTNKFFALNGYPCPPMRNPASHYLRTINKDFDEENTNTIQAIGTLIKAYKSSDTYLDVRKRVHEIYRKVHMMQGITMVLLKLNETGLDFCGTVIFGMRKLSLEKGERKAGFINQCIVLTKRSSVNMYRDLGYYWLRLGIYVSLCVCAGTVFYQLDSSFGSIQTRGGVLMFVAAFLTFMAIGGFPSFVEDMKVFTRERLNGHYGVGAFVVANTISSGPYLFLISVLPGAIVYYLVGLHNGFSHFVYFALVLYTCMLLVESLMMIVASIIPNFLLGIITGAGLQGVMMLDGGFFRLPNEIPKYFWKYPMSYIAFHKYANQGFYKNEFEGMHFPRSGAKQHNTISGEEILRNIWQVEMGYSKWVDLGILFGMVIMYRVMFWGIIKTVEKVKPMIRSSKAPIPENLMHPDHSYSAVTPLHI